MVGVFGVESGVVSLAWSQGKVLLAESLTTPYLIYLHAEVDSVSSKII